MEKKFFDDNPFFIESEIEEERRIKKNANKKIATLQEKLKKAKEKQQQREQRIKQHKPTGTRKTYRKVIPKDKAKSEGDNR